MLGVAATSAADRVATLEEVVNQLIAEAKELDELKAPSVPPQWKRPHPLLGNWEPQMGEVVLDRLMQKFTGNKYRDNYIRWHLIWVVQRMLEARFEQFRINDQHEVPEDIGARLMELVRTMPKEIRGAYRHPWWRYEPEHIAAQYHALRNATYIKVGFPPFEREYWGADAVPLHHASRQEEMKQKVAEMERLLPLFESIHDHEVVAYNQRIRELNLTVREYRGDLIYAIIQTGDPKRLVMVVREIGKKIDEKQWIGLDLMAYMYLAAFDGYLALYDEELLTDVGKEMKNITRRADTYVHYMRGNEPIPNWVIPNQRNFEEYAYHLVELLKTPDTVRQFLRRFRAPKGAGSGRNPEQNVSAASLRIDQIRRAISTALVELFHPEPDNEILLPNYKIRSHRDLWWYLQHAGIQSPRYQELVHEVGNHALICWAMMAAGEKYQDPRIFKRINWVLSSDIPFVYDRSMRCLMLAHLAPSRWGQYARRDARWLMGALSDKGNWPPAHYGGDSQSWGDHANGQYGALGLWAAQRSGVDIPTAVWRAIDEHWRRTQEQAPGNEPAGWAVGMLNVEGENEGESIPPFYQTVNAPMTAGGVATLTLTERFLYGPQRTQPGRDNVSPALRKGIAWLDQNFDVTATGINADWFYYMWTIQRVGQATGRRTFNGTDWFREITAEMLNRPSADGLWRDPNGMQGTLLSTGFALLYLGNALNPIAVSKIQFSGNWNNRPNDLWNLVEHISSVLEVTTSWQIVGLDQPLYELVESPLLYLATDKPFRLDEDEVNLLRAYIEAGGLLVANPESSDSSVARSFRDLAAQLYPDLPLQQLNREHPVFDVYRKLRPAVQLLAVDNGVRPLMVQFTRDIGGGLQAYDVGRADGFPALTNLYLYAVDRNPRRERLQTDFVSEVKHKPTRQLAAARLRCSGRYNPETGADIQLQRLLARNHDLDLQIRTTGADGLGTCRFALLSALGGSSLSDEEATAIRSWVEGGGTLWMDAAGGSQEAVAALQTMLQKIMPGERLEPVSDQDAIITGQGFATGFDNRRVKYRSYVLGRMGPSNRSRLSAVHLDGRPAIIYSPEDLTAGLAGLQHWGIFGYSVRSARQLVINGVLVVAERARRE